MLIDTHCHLTYDDLATQVDEALARAAAAGVTRVLTVATSPADARAGLALLARRTEVSQIAGIHPHEASKCTYEDLEWVAGLHRGAHLPSGLGGRLVAVGETGLDFHYDFAPPARQEEVFRFQLALAVEVGRPVVIHARKAEQRVCDILNDYPALAGRVVFHCYSADLATARRILEMGNLVSFTGVITFKNAEALREVARFVPDDRFMVETDAPYLSPEPVRKIRPNEPAFVLHTARGLADIRGQRLEALAQATTATAERFFGLRGA